MKRAKIIQKISTLLLLLCIALVITPMQLLHDGFTAHHSEKTQAGHQHNDAIGEDGLHCVLHSIEAISPFLNDIEGLAVAIQSNYQTLNEFPVYLTKAHFFYTLFRRGPPSASSLS